LRGSATAWGSNNDHLWGSARGSISVLDSEHGCEVVCNFLLGFVSRFTRVHKLVEGVKHAALVDLILCVDALSQFVSLIRVDLLRRLINDLLDALRCGLFANIQIDEFVGDYAHLLEGKGLDLGAGETLANPALSLLFVRFNLLLHYTDYNLVVNISKFVEAFFDASGVFSIGVHMVSQQLASGHAFPLEVLRQGLRILLSVTSRGSHKENSATFGGLFELFEQKLERVVWTCNNELLHKVFKEFVNLVFFQELLN